MMGLQVGPIATKDANPTKPSNKTFLQNIDSSMQSGSQAEDILDNN